MTCPSLRPFGLVRQSSGGLTSFYFLSKGLLVFIKVKGNERSDRLSDEVTSARGLRFGRSEVLRSLRLPAGRHQAIIVAACRSEAYTREEVLDILP